MNKEILLKSLAGTLDASLDVRKRSEKELHQYEIHPGFTAYLLSLMVEEDVPLGVKISAAILFKNRVVNYWVLPANKEPNNMYIGNEEKETIRDNIVLTLTKIYKNSQLRVQVTTALHNILGAEKWEALIPLMKKLISEGNNIDYVYTGLLCLYEYTKNYRWTGLESPNSSNPVLEDITIEIFPALEVLLENLISSDDSQVSDEMLYLTVKVFKYTTYSSLESYLKQPDNLGKWSTLQLQIISRPLPSYVLKEDSLDLRSSLPRIKAVKWCFGNFYRMLMRHGGGFSTRDKADNPFAKMFLQNFVPEILNSYWNIIEKWSSKQIWLSEDTLYYLISFLEQLVETPDWPLLQEKIDAVLEHIVLPTLSANNDTIELYEDDPEEYIRRFFDINRESNTADVASINLVFRLAEKKFNETIGSLLTIIRNVCDKRHVDRQNLEVAKEAEGALRILATLSHKLEKKLSPVHGQLDQVLHYLVNPEMSTETMVCYPWLTARACDTLSMFFRKYSDELILQDIFQGVVRCFQNEGQFPIQLTAIDALNTLVEDEKVASFIADQVPQLMSTLLDMSKKFESEILTGVMNSFVEKFSSNLAPYAQELSSSLGHQFIKVASECLERESSDSGNLDLDKEYQASGLLGTLNTLIVAVNSSPDVAASIELVVEEIAKFVLDNAMVTFLTEIIEMLESILFSTQKVSPSQWSIFLTTLDAFDTYAADYFDTFQPYFEAVINYGFTKDDVTVENPFVQRLMSICFNTCKSDDLDPIFADCSLLLLELIILAMKDRFLTLLPRFLPEIYAIFMNLESEDAFDGHMLHHLSILKIFFASIYVDVHTSVQFLRDKNFLDSFFQLWIRYSDDFQSVYGCKMQIISSLFILTECDLSVLGSQDTVNEIIDILFSNLLSLPQAILTRQEILSDEHGMKQYAANVKDEEEEGETDFYNDALLNEELDDDEAELEAMKQTPIDNVNVYDVFSVRIAMLQQDPNRYTSIFGCLDHSQQEMTSNILQLSQEHRRPQ